MLELQPAIGLAKNNHSGIRPLQISFLDALRREGVPVCVYLVNGIKLQGQIEAYDVDVILLKSHLSQIIFKHAISTIVPARPIIFKGFDEDAQ